MHRNLRVLLLGVLLGDTGCDRRFTAAPPPGPAPTQSQPPPSHDPQIPAGDHEEGAWWIGETAHYRIHVQKGLRTPATGGAAHSRLLELKSKMELMYEKYSLAFGVHRRFPMKAILRIYRDPAAYQAAGGPSGSAAYYHPRTQELVACEDAPEAGTVFNLLCHEGCHQFFDLAFPGFYERPDFPMWFSEGLADCFGSSELRGGDLYVFTLSGLARGRIEVVKQAVKDHAHPSLKQLMGMNRGCFMVQADLHYALAWSLVHFLWNSPSLDSGNGTYREVVVKLIEGLRTGHSGEELTREAFQLKGKPLDLDRLEREWEVYVKSLKPKK